MEQDARRGTEYVRTLYVYLCNEMAIVHTAQALYIHRSSLLKRLERSSGSWRTTCRILGTGCTTASAWS